MFARGVFSFHPAPLPACPEKSLTPIIPARLSRAPVERDTRRARKSNHSRTYGIAGGGGWTGLFVRPIRRASNPFISPTCQISVRNSLVSFTYAKTRGCTPVENVGAPTFLIFPLLFSTFLPLTGLQHNRGKEERGWLASSVGTSERSAHKIGDQATRRRRRRLGLRLGRGRGRGGVRE